MQTQTRRERIQSLLESCHQVVRVIQRTLDGRLGFLFRIMAAVLLLSLILVRVDIHRLLTDFLRVNPLLMGISLLGGYVGWIVNSHKWQRLLRMYGLDHNLSELYQLNLVAIFHGIALPGRVTGEVLKAVRLANREQHRHAIYVSVFLDRLTGMVGLAALGVAALLMAPQPANGRAEANASLIVLGSILVVGCLALFALTLTGSIQAMASDEFAPLKQLLLFITNIATTNGNKPSRATLAGSLLLGILFQAIGAGGTWILATAVGISISPLELTWIMAITSLIQFFPLTVAGLGVREATYVGLLGLYRVPANLALTMSLLTFGLSILLGLTGVIIEWFSRRHLQRYPCT